MTTPFSKYEILGRIVETVTHMPADANQLALCNAVACSVWDYLQDPDIMKRFAPIKLGKPASEIIKDTPRGIFDTEHVDDIPAEIKSKKAMVAKNASVAENPTDSKTESVATPAPRTTPVVLETGPDGLPILDILWRERPFDLDKCYLGQYSNPCTTSLGKCRKPCVQTELWLFDKETDELTTVDVEFADLETLRNSLDPYVEYTKKHRTPPVYVDKELNDAMDDLAATAKEMRAQQTKNRLQHYVELYKMGFKVSQIAREMGINEQYVYNLKNQAKNKGLIK